MSRFAFLVAVTLFFASLPTAQAQLYWDINGTNLNSSDGGDATATWNSSNAFWSPNISTNGTDATGPWVADSAAVFSSGGSSTYTVHLADAESASGLTFNDTSVKIDSTGGTLTLSGATPTINIPAAGNVATISAPLAGTSGFSLTGGALSTLVLNSTSGANTYSGATIVGAAAGGTVLQLGAAGQIPDGSVLTMAHGSSQTKFDMNGKDETVRSINSTSTGAAPTIAIGANTLTINDQAGDTNTYTGLYTTTAGGKIVKNGDGTLILNNFPTGFVGGEFIVNSGILGIGQNNVFGTNGNGAKLTINPDNLATGPTLKRTGATINLSTPFINIGGNFTYDNNGGSDTQLNGLNGASTTTLKADNPVITVTGDTIVDGSKTSGTFIFAGDIVDDGNVRGFTKSGPGTLTLGSSLNSYRGETTITQGALNVRYQTNSARIGFSRIGDGNGRINLSGGTLSYNGSAHATTGPPSVTDQPRHFTVTNPLRVTADSTIAYASVTSGLTDAADITNGAGPDGVVFEFTSNSVDTTGGTLTLRHNGLSQGLTYRPTFSGSGFNYTGPVVLSGAGTRKTVFQSSNTSGTQTWSGVISGTGSYARSGAGGTTVFTGANTFAGGVTVTAGTLTASGASATLGGGNVTVTGGNIAIDNASANAIANSATLSLAGGGAAGVADVAFANLVAGLNDTIAGLILAGNTLGAGTYGSSTSGAANPGLAGLGLNPNEFFSGNGIVTVVLPGLPGDFNSDGKVDAGDYVTWRKNNGTNNALANDGGLGTPVGTNHYNLWRANFGNPPGAGSGGGLSAGEVPEPGTLVLLVCAVGSCLTMASRARCRRRG